MKQIKNLTVVGGGTAGLISAIILKIRCDINVNVIYSSKIGTIGVGEGSTEHFADFMEFAGIKPSEIITECDATFKSGVMFDGWKNNKRYFHNVTEVYDSKLGQYHHVYGKLISDNSKYLYPNSMLNNLIFGEKIDFLDTHPPVNQYHFNTFKLNEFLLKIAKKNNINIIDDDIDDVVLDNSGNIIKLIGKKTNYLSDFFIDASGFKRILMNKLDAKWISFGKYLKMKSAITFLSEDTEEYDYWTLAKAMDCGWLFRTPVFGRHGNGYIYDSDFINADQAKIELEKTLNCSVDIGRTFNFDTGMLENVWIKNCVAIGLSSSFFEPLEATSIGLTIQQTFLLMHRLANYDDMVVSEYNECVRSMAENARDFIILHYLGKKNNTEFWKSILNTEIPDSLKYNLEKWKKRIPIEEDFIKTSSYKMFGAQNFTLVLHGLDLFDKKEISKEYNFISNNLKNFTETIINQNLINEKNTPTVSHKKALEYIRSTYGK